MMTLENEVKITDQINSEKGVNTECHVMIETIQRHFDLTYYCITLVL